MVEKILQDYQQAYGLKSAILRYFNAAGADPDLETGELHEPETHLVPLVILAALGMTGPIKIFGNDYNTRDGTAIRDYIHVSDLAIAHVKALDKLLHTDQGFALNLGTGIGTSVMDVVNAVTTLGYRVPYEFSARRIGDPPQLVASSENAYRILNWSPKYSSIEQIVDTALRWQTEGVKRYI
jgi:UDP-glucose 4-epimerase